MELLVKVFQELVECQTISEVDRLLIKHGIQGKFHFSEATYPKIPFKITKQEIDDLLEKGILGNDYTFLDISGFTSTEKLLYALVWKNGDLKKLRHIVAGILAQPDYSSDQALVFHQFGKFLNSNPEEPIIDQHVLRAFALYYFRGDSKIVERYKKLSVISKKEAELIRQYKQWLSEGLTYELRLVPDYRYHVDKVLFALGKYIKGRN